MVPCNLQILESAWSEWSRPDSTPANRSASVFDYPSSTTRERRAAGQSGCTVATSAMKRRDGRLRSVPECAPALFGDDLFNSLQRGILPVQTVKRILRRLQLFQHSGGDTRNLILKISGTHAALPGECIPVSPEDETRVSLVAHGKRQIEVDAFNGAGADEVVERRQAYSAVGVVKQ